MVGADFPDMALIPGPVKSDDLFRVAEENGFFGEQFSKGKGDFAGVGDGLVPGS